MSTFADRHHKVYGNRELPVCYCGQEVAAFHKECLAMLTPSGDLPWDEDESQSFAAKETE